MKKRRIKIFFLPNLKTKKKKKSEEKKSGTETKKTFPKTTEKKTKKNEKKNSEKMSRESEPKLIRCAGKYITINKSPIKKRKENETTFDNIYKPNTHRKIEKTEEEILDYLTQKKYERLKFKKNNSSSFINKNKSENFNKKIKKNNKNNEKNDKKKIEIENEFHDSFSSHSPRFKLGSTSNSHDEEQQSSENVEWSDFSEYSFTEKKNEKKNLKKKRKILSSSSSSSSSEELVSILPNFKKKVVTKHSSLSSSPLPPSYTKLSDHSNQSKAPNNKTGKFLSHHDSIVLTKNNTNNNTKKNEIIYLDTSPASSPRKLNNSNQNNNGVDFNKLDLSVDEIDPSLFDFSLLDKKKLSLLCTSYSQQIRSLKKKLHKYKSFKKMIQKNYPFLIESSNSKKKRKK